MDPNQIPYVLLSHYLDVARRRGGKDRIPVWICLNLMDHRALGLGTDRETAIEQMRVVTRELIRRDAGGAGAESGDVAAASRESSSTSPVAVSTTQSGGWVLSLPNQRRSE